MELSFNTYVVNGKQYKKDKEPVFGCRGCAFSVGASCHEPIELMKSASCSKENFIWKEVKIVKQKPQKLGRDGLVQTVLAYFDFDKVQKVMQALNWKWVSSKTSNQIPTISEQVLLAKTYLEMAYDGLANNKTDRYYCGSGGFKAIATRYEDGEIVLELDFVVTEFNWSSQDTCY